MGRCASSCSWPYWESGRPPRPSSRPRSRSPRSSRSVQPCSGRGRSPSSERSEDPSRARGARDDADPRAARRASGLRARARLRRHPRDAAPPGRIRGRRGRAGCRGPRARPGAGGRRSGRSAGRELRRRRGTGGRRSLRRSCTQGDPGRARWLGVDHQPALTVEHQWDDLLLAEDLAQDQARALVELALPRVRAAIYDGDTPPERRPQIRHFANVVLTNPDTLHIGVLPRHDLWADVLHNLRYVVVDEAHVYRGVFGSHVSNVLRRLRRLARVYGAEPQFLLASATIANPGELASSLLGVDTTVVGEEAAPRAERTIALWNPELIDAELGLRAR